MFSVLIELLIGRQAVHRRRGLALLFPRRRHVDLSQMFPVQHQCLLRYSRVLVHLRACGPDEGLVW